MIETTIAPRRIAEQWKQEASPGRRLRTCLRAEKPDDASGGHHQRGSQVLAILGYHPLGWCTLCARRLRQQRLQVRRLPGQRSTAAIRREKVGDAPAPPEGAAGP